jgi:DNA (cytosine-5)-methyltransferase 1
VRYRFAPLRSDWRESGVSRFKIYNMKILNLYAGIGGNRKLWGDGHDITAVEYNEEIAGIYADHFPNDRVVVADAHEYLLQNYRDFDFIWSSVPCTTHSRSNLFLNAQGIERYPDMKLWQEIIFLQHFCKAKFVVENVQPYYEPLVRPTIQLGRHLFWSNFKIKPFPVNELPGNINRTVGRGSVHFGFNLSAYKIKHRKDQILRNCVEPDLGLYIMEQANGVIRREAYAPGSLFSDCG